ncbi:aldolase/citrate lyase family protein [Micromonospora echinospora]|uniref:aldolase/citrate lyase family protein n=1 Tax=Micromonospora echinospora TaxID=1877 RepID=UPI003A880F9B
MTAVGRAVVAARSYLYVPADQPDKVARAADRGADACILDLEDAVAPANKAAARSAVGAFLAADPGSRPAHSGGYASTRTTPRRTSPRWPVPG